MMTLVDTNVLIDLLENDTKAADEAEAAMVRCAEQGDLLFPMVCYAELSVRFVSRSMLDTFLRNFAIRPIDLGMDAAFLAGKLFAEHVRTGGRQGRVLPDFLVGAQALLAADRLLTRDKSFFTEMFRGLTAVRPSEFT